jgi:hypothetical protein
LLIAQLLAFEPVCIFACVWSSVYAQFSVVGLGASRAAIAAASTAARNHSQLEVEAQLTFPKAFCIFCGTKIGVMPAKAGIHFSAAPLYDAGFPLSRE